MKKKTRRSQANEECCVLCRFSDDDPALFGEKIRVDDDGLTTVHYFCLLTSCGVYQRAEEHEGVLGFLVDDIKQEIRRCARLTCWGCKKKGACVGCNVRSCRRTVHFPCGRKLKFVSQFTDFFPSYCAAHSPSQSLAPGLVLTLPESCSVCLDSLSPVLSYDVIKCPSCHAGWSHRDCLQRQAHSAGLFFFRCTLCNNKENFQQEMMRMGIFIPERDASWELEADAYSELLEVHRRCDAVDCVCDGGRTHSAKSGWFEVIRCSLCGSSGTHRRCSALQVTTRDWTCSVCTRVADRPALLVSSPEGGQRQTLLSKRHPSPIQSPVTCKRTSDPVSPESPQDLLQALVPKLCPPQVQVEMCGDQALRAGLQLVRRRDFDPSQALSIRLTEEDRLTTSPRSLGESQAPLQYFLDLLVQQVQDCEVFEGPDGCKNLKLDSEALRDDLYFDVGTLLALALVHGARPLGFFSAALFQSLFDHVARRPLTVAHMTPDTPLTRQVSRMASVASVDELKDVMAASGEYLELAGCNRPISSLQERDVLVEDLVNFTMITRMQLPLQRLRSGLQTLGVFDQVLLFPSVFRGVFCDGAERLSEHTLTQLFVISHSQQEDQRRSETNAASHWRRFLLDCEVGRSSVSLQDLLQFSTGVQKLPAVGLLPPPSISFLHPLSSGEERAGGAGGGGNVKEWREKGLFPQSKPEARRLLLPVTSSYWAFKSAMEQAVSHHVHLPPPTDT